MERIGLFGGTFDPIHLGHIRAAREVMNGFSLDKIVFIPSSSPPHKNASGVVIAEDRLEMIRLALAGQPGFCVSDTELKRPGPSYSIDTVHYFQQNAPKEALFFLILGHDAFFEIHTWKSYQELFRIIPLIVLLRPGHPPSNGLGIHKDIATCLKTKISRQYRFSLKKAGYFHPDLKPVYLFSKNLVDISSTSVRNRIKNGDPIRSLVPGEVVKWISRKNLYQ